MPRAEPISTASEVELKILERTVRGDTARRVPFFVPGGDMERSVRCLLAWMNEGEAINALLGRLPGLGEDVQTQRATWEAARDANNARPAFRPPTAVFEELPPELRAAGAAFSQRPDAIAAFQSMEWSVGMADLHEVLSFQRIVAEEQSMERVDAAIRPDDLGSIFSFCLPDPVGRESLPGTVDADQKGITFSSLNPNLRVGGMGGSEIDVAIVPGQPATRQNFIGFAINFGSPFVQVAEYNGRWFVRDGYHRCFGLLRRGISKVPCVSVRPRSFAELGAMAPGFFPYEVLFSDRPPYLRDFLDDSVAFTTKQAAHRKVVRLRAEEFIVAV